MWLSLSSEFYGSGTDTRANMLNNIIGFEFKSFLRKRYSFRSSISSYSSDKVSWTRAGAITGLVFKVKNKSNGNYFCFIFTPPPIMLNNKKRLLSQNLSSKENGASFLRNILISRGKKKWQKKTCFSKIQFFFRFFFIFRIF